MLNSLKRTNRTHAPAQSMTVVSPASLPTQLDRIVPRGTDRRVWLGLGLANEETCYDLPDAAVGEVVDVHLDFAQIPHALILADGGLQKTGVAVNIVHQWTQAGNVAVVADGAGHWGGPDGRVAGWEGVLWVAQDWRNIGDVVLTVRDEMEARFEKMTAEGVSDYQSLRTAPTPLLLVVDFEDATFLLRMSVNSPTDEFPHARANIEAMLRDVGAVVRLGRAAGVHVVVVADNTDLLATNLVNNLEGRILLGEAPAPARPRLPLLSVNGASPTPCCDPHIGDEETPYGRLRRQAALHHSRVRVTPGVPGRGLYGRTYGDAMEVQFAC